MLYFCQFPIKGDVLDITCVDPVKEKFLSTGTRMVQAAMLPSGPIFTQEATMFGASPEQAIAHSFYGLLIAKARHRRLNPKLVLGLIAGDILTPTPNDLVDADPGDEDDALRDSLCFGINEKPYRPSSCDDGYAFTSHYCDRCRHDLEAGQEGCEILVLALIGEQPKEWRWISGVPTCTKFSPNPPAPKPVRKNKSQIAPGQLTLFPC